MLHLLHCLQDTVLETTLILPILNSKDILEKTFSYQDYIFYQQSEEIFFLQYLLLANVIVRDRNNVHKRRLKFKLT